MPKKSPHPHVSWRDGRPRFNPDARLRQAGYKARDLKHEDGSWFSRGEAVDWSDAFVKKLAAARAADVKRTAAVPKPVRRAEAYTVARMFNDWFESPKFVLPRDKGGYSPLTIADTYHSKARVIENDHPLIWNAPAAWVEKTELRAMFEEIWIGRKAGDGDKAVEARGLATARGTVLTLSACYRWAILKGKVRRPDNPAHRLEMQKPAPRIRFGTRPEIDALVRGADMIGRPEWGDMVLLAIWTGQRQGDRVELLHKGMLNGRRHFRQAKTGAVVAILEAPLLEARLKAAMERRRAKKAAELLAYPAHVRHKVEQRFAHVVLDETRWLPFSGDHWSRCYAELRGIVAEGIVDVKATEAARAAHAAEDRNTDPPTVYRLAPVPSVATLWDLDFRDTAVTWMALAGATVPQIIAVTGHELETATQILKHYLARHPEMADEAIRKMVAWYEGGGETEFGL